MKQIYPTPATRMDATDQAAFTFATIFFKLCKSQGEIAPEATIVKVWRSPALPVQKIQMELSDGTVTDLEFFQLQGKKVLH
jgi:hypothetical protein